MSRIGQYLPSSVSRLVLPRVPARFQRFQSAINWGAAADQASGYSTIDASPSAPALGSGRGPGPGPGHIFDSRSHHLIAAFGVALSRSISTSTVRVLDFGGADGIDQTNIAPVFDTLEFEWNVVEHPSAVERYSARPRPGVTFTSDLDTALEARVDIALASASLNYVPDPLSVLEQLAKRSDFVILSRLPLWPQAEHGCAIQSVKRESGVVQYPTWFFAEDAFLARARTFGEIAFRFDVPEDRAYFNGHYGTYQGLVLDCRSNAHDG